MPGSGAAPPDPPVFGWYQPIASALPPRTTQSEAVRCAQAIEVGLHAQERLASRCDVRPTGQQLADLRLLVREGLQAAGRLFLGNLRLVFRWSKGSAASVGPESAQDAFQAGCVGLGEAIRRWDHRRGGAFSTYASWYIRKQVWLWRQAERATSRESSVDLALDEPGLAWDGGLDRVAERQASVEDVRFVLSRLTPRQAEILRRRHGLDPTAGPMTLDAIGRSYGVTRERVRQIERDAFASIRSTVGPSGRGRPGDDLVHHAHREFRPAARVGQTVALLGGVVQLRVAVAGDTGGGPDGGEQCAQQRA